MWALHFLYIAISSCSIFISILLHVTPTFKLLFSEIGLLGNLLILRTIILFWILFVAFVRVILLLIVVISFSNSLYFGSVVSHCWVLSSNPLFYSSFPSHYNFYLFIFNSLKPQYTSIFICLVHVPITVAEEDLID